MILIKHLYYIKDGIQEMAVFGPEDDLTLCASSVVDDAVKVGKTQHRTGTDVWYCVREGQSEEAVQIAVLTLSKSAIDTCDRLSKRPRWL